MKIIAIIFNILLLIWVAIFLADEGMPTSDDEFIGILLIIITPIFSLFTLYLSNLDSWLGLYFKRKSLEERTKIVELEKQTNSQHNNIQRKD